MSSPLPSPIEAWEWMGEANPPEWVFRHVASVERLASAMAQAAASNGHTVNLDLVRVGAILHDVGRSITQEPKHAHLGAEWLRNRDAPEELIRIVERHTGAGVLPQDAETIGVPVKDYTPQSVEEKLVAHADNLYSGDKRLSLAQLQSKYDAKGLPEAMERIRALHAEMETICGVDLEALAVD